MHGWLARGEDDIPPTREWLSPEEAGRLDDLRFTKRRTEYLLRRWVGKQAVATAAGLPADAESLRRIVVANRADGSPYVLVDGEPLGLDVSLTDRAGWAVCIVGADLSRLGCDLELVEPRSDGFVTDFLTAEEQEYVGAHAEPEVAANLLWSAKESALKVLRTGLRRDTRSVPVDVGKPADTGWGRLDITPTEGGRIGGWWRREGAFLLTTACDRPFEPPDVLPRSADLSRAVPVHSWVERPVVD